MHDEIRLFALSESRPFGRAVAAALGTDLDDHLEQTFEDGEHRVRPNVNVRGRDVFVIQSLYADDWWSIHDKLCRLLFFLGALRDAAATRVTAVVPYLCYQRTDRKTQPRDPISTRYLAGLFDAVDVDRVLTMDVHNLAAFQNAFQAGTEHLEARPLLVQRVAEAVNEKDLVVVSPDEGGVKRAGKFAEGLRRVTERSIPTAFVEKIRRNERDVTGGRLAGPVEGRVAVIVDDLISTGGTITQAAAACAQEGAHSVCAAVTHGLFVGKAQRRIAESSLDALFVTNTVAPNLTGSAGKILCACDAAPRFAAAIEAIHTEASVSALNEVT